MSELGNVSFDKGQILGPFGVGHVELLIESKGSRRTVLDDCALTQAIVEVDSVASIPPC